MTTSARRLAPRALLVTTLAAAALPAQPIDPPGNPPPPPPPHGNPPPPPPPPPLEGTIPWTANAVPLRGRVGTIRALTCPPGGEPGTVWGTNVYTDDSSICGAAAHAGIISLAVGGAVSLRVFPGLAAYRGSSRNGVTTLDYATYPGSFSFVGINTSMATWFVPSTNTNRPVAPGTITWSDNASTHRGRNGALVRVRCPPGGAPGTIWGSAIYTDDSSICGAAAHAGRITLAAGGAVVIRIAPGRPAYRGSARNGVTTLDYDDYPGSFTVLPRP